MHGKTEHMILAIVGSYQVNSKWTVSATWVLYTGDAVTFPAGKVPY